MTALPSTSIPVENNYPYLIVLATRNMGKVAELRHALTGMPVELLTVSDFPDMPEVEEDALTLEGNAEKKARSIFEYTGLPALADDTGLEVEALDGRPGVFAARYAGPGCTPADNRKKMLQELDGVANRSARFRTAIAFVQHDEARFFEGICDGYILDHERGDGGFGYDAIFVPTGLNRTFAELNQTEKNAISHRGKALERFIEFLKGLRI